MKIKSILFLTLAFLSLTTIDSNLLARGGGGGGHGGGHGSGGHGGGHGGYHGGGHYGRGGWGGYGAGVGLGVATGVAVGAAASRPYYYGGGYYDGDFCYYHPGHPDC